MKIGELKRIQEAPQSGIALAYTTKTVLFRRYGALAEVSSWSELSEGKLLELHLFDSTTEYRAIETEGKRAFDGSAPGTIEYVKEDRGGEDVLKEHLLLERDFIAVAESLTVKNYIHYNEDNGMAVIDDYRLVDEV